jgi:transposase InsO family protein
VSTPANTDHTVRTKLALLQLADELNSVTRACQIMGYSRDSYYRFKKLYEKGGELALKNLDRRKPMYKNRISAEIEREVVEVALDYPNYGQEKVSRLLKARNTNISASGVRAIWKRHDLETVAKRLNALHAFVEQEERELTKEQRISIENLHKISTQSSDLEASYPGNLGVQDTFYIGNVPGIGDLYQQTFIDAYTKIAHAHIYQVKNASASVDMLNKYIIPWYAEKNLRLEQILTDRGAEFYGGSKDDNLYQQELRKNGIDHIKMRAYNGPEVNGICARFHSFQKTAFYDVLMRNHGISDIEELESKLQKWLTKYNTEIPHQERYCYGKTPQATYEQSKHLAPKI